MIKKFNEFNKEEVNEDIVPYAQSRMGEDELEKLKDWIVHEIVSGVSDEDIADQAGAYAFNTVDLIGIIRDLLELEDSDDHETDQFFAGDVEGFDQDVPAI